MRPCGCGGSSHAGTDQILLLIPEPRESGVSRKADIKIIKHYTPPCTSDLEALKGKLNKTGNEMADIAGLSDGRQWRKYTGGASPRELSAQMLFFIAARLTLPADQLDALYEKMRELGAELDFEDPAN